MSDMGKALNAITSKANHDLHHVQLGEIADGKYSANTLKNPPSLRALKLQDILMKNAGGRICDDRWHEFSLATFKHIEGMGNLTHEDVVQLFEELRGATLRHVNKKEGHTAVYGLVAVGRVDFEDVGKVRYKFDEEFRKVMEKSDLYAVLDYRTTMALSSRYAHRLHQMIALRAGRQKNIERFTVEDIRARLGVETGKLLGWSEFRKRALEQAIKEVNLCSRFHVEYRVSKKEKRKTVEIEMSWEIKQELEGAKKAQKSHSQTRKAILKGQEEHQVNTHPFPATGGLAYDDYWRGEAKRIWSDEGRNPRDFPDTKLIADHVRKRAQDQNIALDDVKIQKLFDNIIKKWK